MITRPSFHLQSRKRVGTWDYSV